MSEREQQEWAGLWVALFGEPPPIVAEVSLTARILIACLPPTAPYEPGAAEPMSPGS